jgi:hypothetical protein
MSFSGNDVVLFNHRIDGFGNERDSGIREHLARQ